jgi:hypothetical protein
MSDTMLDDLAEFFKDKNLDMECHEYCAHITAPYSRQQIRKEFKSYETMIGLLKSQDKELKVSAKIKLAPGKTKVDRGVTKNETKK